MQLLQEHCLKYKEYITTNEQASVCSFSLIYAYKILSINVGVEMLGDVWYNWGDKFFVWGCAVAEINYAPQSKMLCCRFH